MPKNTSVMDCSLNQLIYVIDMSEQKRPDSDLEKGLYNKSYVETDL